MHMKSNHILMSVLFSSGRTLWPLSVDISPKFSSSSCRVQVCSSDTCPLLLSALLVSQLATDFLLFPDSNEMFPVILILFIFCTLVSYLSLTSQCPIVGSAIVNPGCNQSRIKVSLMLFTMVFLGQRSAWWRIAKLHDFCMLPGLVMNTWPLNQRVLPPWQLPSSRKNFARWCYVNTTPYLPIKRLIEMGASYFLPASHWFIHCPYYKQQDSMNKCGLALLSLPTTTPLILLFYQAEEGSLGCYR